jgi:hemerythrin-like domain-containing protein
MRINKNLRADQEIIKRYLDVLGGGSIALGNSKLAQPGFFIAAHGFINEYIEDGFFKKEDLLIKALEDSGFPSDEGPIGFMRSDQQKSREAAGHIITAAKLWQGGDDIARSELGWAVSEYTSTLRQHLDRIRNLIIPLLEQALSIEDEQKIADGLNVVFKTTTKSEQEKYIKQVESLEEELSDWR